MKTTTDIKKILIPIDFSETGMLAMEHAVLMARLLKAELYLLHVVEAFEYTYSIYEPEAVIRDTAGINEIAQEKLSRLAGKISKENGINVQALIESGKPAAEISGVVKDYGINLIVMGTHGAHGFEEYFIGSNAHKVVNIAPCPVITIQTHAKKMGFKNIVMPIDNSLYSRQKVDYVIKLGHLYDSKIHILGLLDHGEEVDEKKFDIKLDSVENALKKTGLRYVRKIAKGHNVAEEAMKYANEVKADLLVIMTDHESTLRGAFLGSLAKQIVNHSRVPVLSIRPLQEGRLDPVHMSAAAPLF